MLVAPKPAPAEEIWTPVMGAQVLFRPIDRPMIRAARRSTLAALGRDNETDKPSGTPAEQIEELGDAMSLALLMTGIVDWRDVCEMPDEDATGDGIPMPCTDENKAILLADPMIFEAFDSAYVIPFVTRERERNAPGKGSPLSQNGTGPAETEESAIATSPAPLAGASDAVSVPTSSKPRKRTRKKTSGAS